MRTIEASATARLVAETDSTIAIYAPAMTEHPEAGPGPLVVTFPHLTSRLQGVHFWQDVNLRRAGVSALGLMSKHPHWFPRQEMARLLPSLLPIIARHRPDRIVTWGYSMGATPALMYGRAFGADLTVSLSPHYSIDPMIIRSFDTRKHAFDPKLHRGLKVEADDLSPRPVLFYDPLYALDREHARRIEALSARVRRVVTTGSGHFSMSPFIVTESATTAFVHLLVRGSPDDLPRQARNLLRASRDLSADYHQELSGALLRHGRGKLALREAIRAVELQPQNARRRINLIDLREALATG